MAEKIHDSANEHSEVYRDEANELLIELETSLLELEACPDDADLIARIFRAMHTIKGSGAMFGFNDIAEFTHEVETVFDLVRNGKIAVTKNLINLALAARDQIKLMLNASDSDAAFDRQKSNEIITALKDFLPAEKVTVVAESEVSEDIVEKQETNISYWIRFKPDRNIFLTGTNPISLLDELRGLGQSKIIAQTDTVPGLSNLNPELCYTYWDIILTTKHSLDTIKDVFIFVEDESEIKVSVIDEDDTFEEDDYKKLGEILVTHGDLKKEDLQKALKKQQLLGEMLVKEGLVDSNKVEAALAEQKYVREQRQTRQKVQEATSIRVASDKLDTLVDLVGELVTVQSRLSESAPNYDSDLMSIAEEVERLTAELRDNTMSIRMLPIGTTFGKFKRLVRDLSNELGKEVDLQTEGAETELDKTVIEQLGDPLVHLIRNSLDHGIESPDLREKNGKPRCGKVLLSAVHSGANVLIKIKDDGAGLDADVIRAKAEEKELIATGAELTEKEIFALLFAPGFSTAKEVTNVSGRGVGMDVVKRAIENLRGTIDVHSEKGIGTTITLKLPLTLAIIEGLLVVIGDERYVLPLSAVKECIELSRDDVAKSHGRKVANVRGEIVPYIHLRERFLINGKVPDIEQIVIVEFEHQRVGFVVDYVLGEHQTVIKSLGSLYSDIKEISGATILGDGTVALILDLNKLFESVEVDEIQAMEKNAKAKQKLSDNKSPVTEIVETVKEC